MSQPTLSAQIEQEKMTPTRAVEAITSGLRSIQSGMYGDDSPLPNVWEELKEQLQSGPSSHIELYLETVRQFVTGLLSELDDARP